MTAIGGFNLWWSGAAYGGTAPKFCTFHKRGLLPLPPVEHTKLRSCTRGRGKVLEQTGGQVSVRGTRQRAVVFLLRYLGI